ncbi:MAG TPA: IPT/TIG domain-containing protein [Anaerolineales bacterium]|jgi:hypothetical protein
MFTHMKRFTVWKEQLRSVAIILMIVFSTATGGLTPVLAASSNSLALAITPSNGTMISANMTLPRGAVFLNDGQGGHWWVSDAVQGLCRLDANAAAPGGFQKGTCNGTVKSGGEIVVGDTPTTALDGTKYVYVADDASKSINVVRFKFVPGAAGQAGNVSPFGTWGINNLTQKGGGLAGGRPVALALTLHAGGGQDLYIGYLKSGDIMRVDNPQNIASNVQIPPQAKIGSTSDGIGVNSFVMFGNDLYIAEIGGFGLSRIADPSGIARPACTAASQCTAVSVSPSPSFFPGGLATDGTYIYLGVVQLGGVANDVYRYDPATGVRELYSATINPSYVSGGTTYTTYSGPLGLGYNPANGDLFVGDDPQFSAAAPVTNQGHIWKVTHPLVVVIPTVASIAPITGTSLGGDLVTITGTNFSATPGATTVNFGANLALNVTCVDTTTCTATSPAGLGTVDVTVTVNGQTSAISAADQFTYVTVNPNSVIVTGVSPNTGATTGGTLVTITGNNFALAGTTINFGAIPATNVVCASITSCTAVSPAAAAGIVDIQVTDATGTSAVNPADKFTYIAPAASLYAWGVTAPKGGAVWLPGALGGHWWSSDHAQGFCRQDPVGAGTTLHAINFAVCGDDLVGSAGQGVYDPRPNANGTHYVYVPDNAVKSTAVWRLTFNPATETMVPDPLDGITMATAMTPLADVRTLKPNGMALGPDGNLYVTDLVEKNVRQITNPNGDPRTQVITIVAETGDGRGANGTQGFIGNLLYISGNRAAQFFDITQCPLAGGIHCGMASVPAPTGVFVAGSATDTHTDPVTGNVYKFVYISSSPGAANATIYRYDASKDVYVPFAAGSVLPDAFGVVTCPACTVGAQAAPYITGGILPAAGAPNATVYCALTCTRPWDFGNHPTQGGTVSFAFAFGLATDPSGTLVITEDPTAGARSGRGTMWTVPFIP